MEQITGIVRKVDKLGRVCLPIYLRRENDIMIDDEVEIIGTDEGILIKAHNSGCIFCKSTVGVEEHEGQMICKYHRDFFKRLGSGNTKIPLNKGGE